MRFSAQWLAVVLVTSAAQAQPAAPKEREPEAERRPETDPPIESELKREVPDYDGRGEEPTTVGDVLLWVPRAVLFPLYLVSEFVVRRPLGALVTATEKSDWPGVLSAAFSGEEPGNFGVAPTGLVDYGLRASGGLYFWANDPRMPGHQFRMRAATGGPGYFNLVLKQRIPFAFTEQLSFRGEYDLRSDWVFHGLGPRSSSDPVRYQAELAEGRVAYETRLWRSSTFAAGIALRDVTFDGDADGGGDPSLNEAIASGRLSEPPPGFPGGYTVVTTSLRAALDTRQRRFRDRLPPASDFVSPPGTGVHLAARVEHAAGVRPDEQEWIRWGTTVAGFLDLNQRQRVLGVIMTLDFVEPLADRPVPFTELASLGGSRPLRGFLHQRLLDRSAVAVQADYQYPIWVWLDGHIHYAVGNVFGPRLEGFEPELLRSSFGMGFRSAGSRDHVFEVLAAFGTAAFDDGSEIESFRLLVGTISGF